MNIKTCCKQPQLLSHEGDLSSGVLENFIPPVFLSIKSHPISWKVTAVALNFSPKIVRRHLKLHPVSHQARKRRSLRNMIPQFVDDAMLR